MNTSDRHSISSQSPLPVQDVSYATKKLAVSGETVTFTDGSAGTTQKIKLDYDSIMAAASDRIGQKGDSSIVWTSGLVLTTEIPWKFKNNSDRDNDTDRLATLGNGEYMVDYENGYILGKSAVTTSSTTDTIAYATRTQASSVIGSVTVSGVNLASATNSEAYVGDVSQGLESSSVSKGSAGNFYKATGRINSTAPTGIYYFLLLNHATVPSDGSVTLALSPIKVSHTMGADSYFDIDASPAGIPCSTGISWCLSTTEFTKTEASAHTSVTLLYK